jgi:hypothetical protein
VGIGIRFLVLWGWIIGFSLRGGGIYLRVGVLIQLIMSRLFPEQFSTLRAHTFPSLFFSISGPDCSRSSLSTGKGYKWILMFIKIFYATPRGG